MLERFTIAQARQDAGFVEVRLQCFIDHRREFFCRQDQHAVVIGEDIVARIHLHSSATHGHVHLTCLAADQLGRQLSGATSEHRQLAGTQFVDVGDYPVDDDAGGTRAASRKLRDHPDTSVGMVNPDFVARLIADAPLNEADRMTFFGGDDKGYTDYPTLQS